MDILEYKVAERHYGLDVLKVQEIIQPISFSNVPHAHPYILGIIQLRGDIIPLISMRRVLGIQESNEALSTNEKYIIATVDHQKVALDVDNVLDIHRLATDGIQMYEDIDTESPSLEIGKIEIDQDQIYLLDYSKMMLQLQQPV